MIEPFTSLLLAAASGTKMTLWSLISTTPYLAYKGAVQGGFSKLMEYLIDRYCVMNGKEKKYDICKENIDLTNKILGPIDWIDLESPLKEVPFSLTLRGTNVTDQDLIDHLVGQKMLRRLDVCYCEDITYNGVKQFKKLRPDCRVKDSCSYLRNRIISAFLLAIPVIVMIWEYFT